MKLSYARECYYSHSGNASSSARQAAFAGIALVWVFNQPTVQDPINLASSLVFALLLLAASLLLDLLQYISSAAIWGFYSRRVEKQLSHRYHEDPDISPPAYLNWPGVVCFWAKLVVLVVAYVALIKFLWQYLQ